MDREKVLQTQFNLDVSIAEAVQRIAQISSDLGIKKHNEVDAFRHAYVLAKISKNYGADKAKNMGRLYEINGIFNLNIPNFSEVKMDLRNNDYGIRLQSILSKMKMTPDDEEYLLRTTIKNALHSGQLTLDTQTNSGYVSESFQKVFPEAYGKSKKDDCTEIKVREYERGEQTVAEHTRSCPKN